jgi:hypothetical protein
MREGGGLRVDENEVMGVISVAYSTGTWRVKKYVTSLARSREWSCLN